jgi:serine phosphatase RsbU (regulator of sigma subunit)
VRLPERPSPTRIANVAFLVFFVVYAAGSIIWLLSGIPPILASRSLAVHETLHRWGASDRGYVAISAGGDLGQRVTEGSRWVAARELAVWANTPVVIHFENRDPGHYHNFAVYDGNRAIFSTLPMVGPETEISVPALPPGPYLFKDEFSQSRPAEFVTVERGREIPAWARWVPGLRTAAVGAAIESHALLSGPEILLQYLFSVLNLSLGILLIRLRPNDLAARLLALGMVGTAAVFNATAHSGLQEMPWLARWLHDNYHLFAGLAYVLALLVFPDGRLPTSWSRRRWFTWPVLAVVLVVAVELFTRFRSWFHGDPSGLVLFFGVLIPVAGITSQSFRLHQASSAAQRQQSRVLVWALSLALGAALCLFGLRLALGDARAQELQGLAFVIFPVLFAAIPLTLTAVLVRYRLWDMDRVINQTLVYGMLTGLLGLAYVATVDMLNQLLIWPTVGRNNLFLVAFTVAVALLFRPARDRIQAFIDRSFYRSRYDAARTLEAFSARLRDEIDLDTVVGELLDAAEETMQPARMALWLRPGEGAAEQGQTPAPNRARHGEVVPFEVGRDDLIIGHIEAVAGPLALDEIGLVSPARDALQAAGMRLVVPLVSQARLVGLLALGPRRSERDYAGDDRKLLENLAERAAPAVRVAQLVRQLVRQQAAELQARERIEQELQVAQLIQRQFLPRELPELSGWHVATYYQPAKAVGGDFYDFIELPGGLIGLVCGDVTGKGVPAALVMATTHSILRGDAPQLVSPAKVLERANTLLLHDIPPQMFVTCLYGVLDPATGRLRYANAGHNPPYVHTAGGVVELRATGMPLGAMPDMTYEEKETTLGPGDTVLLHSDGLVEAHDPERRMFGFPRLAELVDECPGGPELIELLLGELDGFTGPGWEQEDDITLVALQRAAVPAVAKPPKAPALVS